MHEPKSQKQCSTNQIEIITANIKLESAQSYKAYTSMNDLGRV